MQHMNSGMSNMNSTESSGATFSSWDSYRLRLLFSSWDITKPWQFALTFFAVMLAVVFYHFLECVTGCFEKGMILYLHEIQVAAPVDSESSDLTKLPTIVYSRPKGWATVKILYGLLCACKFALTLFLMLIAMTLNPSLFLALFVGYLLGDFLFCDYKLNVLMGGHHPLQDHGGIVRKLLQMSLCVNSSQQSHEANELLEAHKVTSTDQMMPIVAVGTLWVLPRVFSLIYLVVLLVWIVETQGGFGFDASTVFGWHALLMSFFVTLFTNEAVLTYTAPLFPQLANHVKYRTPGWGFARWLYGAVSYSLVYGSLYLLPGLSVVLRSKDCWHYTTSWVTCASRWVWPPAPLACKACSPRTSQSPLLP
mmetsp:Transcript_13601/g.20395  ORF Transcript_13601/g.20395 Transcript_13601/m.20395 type:complete len:365 (-) Transcript_13601:429-1523(-)